MALSRDRFLEDLQRTADRNVFVMMRYGRTEQFRVIETAIRDSLRLYGLIARLAKDRAISDDLWDNICLYIQQCKYGIGVFEEIDQRDFNPNISLELGYMYALGRRCLLLKDQRMPRLPTDVCGKIYRDFDTYDLAASIKAQVSSWCADDLGIDVSSATESPQRNLSLETPVFDSYNDSAFATFQVYDTSQLFGRHIAVIDVGANPDHPGRQKGLEIRADATEQVGVHHRVDELKGTMLVDFRALTSGSEVMNLSFVAIPMQEDRPGRRLVEVGAKGNGDPANGMSPYRVRYFVPHDSIGDGLWHQASVDFDFRRTPTASYVMCAARVNEGCPKPGPGALQIRRFQVFRKS